MSHEENGYQKLAQNIIGLVGGQENIEKVIHCVTRLRFYLKDRSKANKEALEDLSDVMGIVEASGQFQVIVGQDVDPVFAEVEVLLSKSQTGKTSDDETNQTHFKDQKGLINKISYGFNQIIGIITGAMMPIISILAASGIIKSILAVGTGTGWISESGNIHLLLNAMADAVFYFLPILIGYNAAKRLDGNPILTAVIAGVIIHPSILEAAENELNILTIGSLEFPFVAYTYSIFPMILAAWLVKVLERPLKKCIPTYVESIFTPIIVIFLVTLVTFFITGPVIMWISVALAEGLQTLLSWNAAIFGGVIAGFYQILVIFGLHWGIIPIYVNDFAVLGYSYLSAIVSFATVGQAGAALAVAVKTKKTKIKELGYAGTISAFAGITEPAIYGINLRFRKPFVCACIGSGVGGFFAGLLRVNMWSIIGSIIGLPSYIDPENGITANFWYAVGITFLTLIVAFLLTYFWGYNDDMKIQKRREKPKKPGAMAK